MSIITQSSAENNVQFMRSENTMQTLIENYKKINKKIVFGFSGDDKNLRLAGDLFNSYDANNYVLIKIAKELEDLFEDCIYIEEFLMEPNDFIKTKVTKYVIKKEKEDGDENNVDHRISSLSTVSERFMLANRDINSSNTYHGQDGSLILQLLEYHYKEEHFDIVEVKNVRKCRSEVKDLKLLSYLNSKSKNDPDYIESVKEYLELKGLKNLIS